jgi:outer membrane protein assembly factor BamB
MAAGCRIGRRKLFLLYVSALACFVAFRGQAAAQFAPSSRYELSEVVDLDEIDNAARMHLARFEQYTAAGQWNEALDTLRLLLETYDDKLIDVGDRRYISMRDYCHQRACQLPPEVLAQWRLSVDPQAKSWYEAGAAQRDPLPLLQVVERSFASSFGDDALLLLGEFALERGDHTAARRYWRCMLPPEQRVEILGPNDGPGSILVFPDTSFSAAEINARLILASILDDNLDRAQRELALFIERFSDAEGQLAGKRGKYADSLSSLLENARLWPQQNLENDWETFAGSAARGKITAASVDLGAKRWELLLPEVPYNELLAYGNGPLRRVASSHPLQRERQRLLSYHPIVVDQLLLVNTSEEILALDLETGRPAWQQAAIFQDTLPPSTRRTFRSGGPGVPRYSMTAHQHRLYARMGPPLTMSLDQPAGNERRGFLVCLDLKAQGRLLWKIYPEHEKLAFEGSPVADGANIYVALRRSDVRPKALVACYDAQTGRRRWIREVCAAETVGRGQFEETTFNLLTLKEGALFLNTNLGAVARLSTRDGHIEWVKVYRDRQEGDMNRLQAYLYRDMTPCLYSEDRIFVAPADDERIYSLSAETGELLWESRYVSDVVHLLGVAHGKLLASGDRLYWIDCETGKLRHFWPDAPAPRGYGRGVLAGNVVYWPIRAGILVFDQSTGELRQNIDLRYRDESATGGNLLIAHNTLLVAAGNRLIAFGDRGRLAAQHIRARSEDSNSASGTQ